MGQRFVEREPTSLTGLSGGVFLLAPSELNVRDKPARDDGEQTEEVPLGTNLDAPRHVVDVAVGRRGTCDGFPIGLHGRRRVLALQPFGQDMYAAIRSASLHADHLHGLLSNEQEPTNFG